MKWPIKWSAYRYQNFLCFELRRGKSSSQELAVSLGWRSASAWKISHWADYSAIEVYLGQVYINHEYRFRGVEF